MDREPADFGRELADREAIRDVLARYCRGVDRADLELLASVYHSDGVDHHGGFDGSGAAFADQPLRTSDENVMAHHMIGTPLIELDGDVAHVETYYACTALRREDGREYCGESFGRYVDRFERRDGEWRIAERTCVIDISRESEIQAWRRAAPFPRGQRWPDDVVYRRGTPSSGD